MLNEELKETTSDFVSFWMSKISSYKVVTIDPERLAYWYLRLNGFLTIENFIVHPNEGANQRTDVDIIGVRFPHRAELFIESEEIENFINSSNPNPKHMEDDKKIICFQSHPKSFVVIAEVKTTSGGFNRTFKTKDVIHSILKAIGILPIRVNEEAAEELVNKGFYSDDKYKISMLYFAEYRENSNEKVWDSVPQITWSEVKEFIYTRFRQFRRQKSAHAQWAIDGYELWKCVMANHNFEDFNKNLRLAPKVKTKQIIVP